MERLNEPSHLETHDALERDLSGATTSTAMPRLRSDADTSSPMKLAPTTTTCLAVFARSTIARLSAERAQIEHLRSVGAGNRRPHRIGASRDQQRAELPMRAIVERHGARRRIDRGHATAQLQIDAALAVQIRRPQRNPVVLRFAGQVVLRQVRPIDRRIVVALNRS